MMGLSEQARAKVNLSLRVLGRRADGYHRIESLVAFAAVGDRLSLEPGAAFSLEVEGRFAGRLEGRNLVARAAEYYTIAHPECLTGAFRLEKRLPVAAGIGGGSADAAAALRLLARANGGEEQARDLMPLACSLGADVSVCLESRPAMMWGIGDKVEALARFPAIHAVLVTPAVGLATAEVFAGLDAPACEDPPGDASRPALPPPLRSVEDVAAYAGAIGNDLELSARALCGEVAAVQQALRMTSGCLLVQLSGSGPTSFGLYRDRRHAAMAAANVGLNPDWWVVETTLG